MPQTGTESVTVFSQRLKLKMRVIILFTVSTHKKTGRGSFHKHGLTLIPVWINHYIHYMMWGEITYPFLNFNGATVEVQEWLNKFIPHFTWHVIIYSCSR